LRGWNMRGIEMSDRDNGHTLAELQAARAEIDRLRRLIRDSTAVDVLGKTYWPEWVTKELGPIGPLPGGD
jgi:hypothetical protein